MPAAKAMNRMVSGVRTSELIVARSRILTSFGLRGSPANDDAPDMLGRTRSRLSKDDYVKSTADLAQSRRLNNAVDRATSTAPADLHSVQVQQRCKHEQSTDPVFTPMHYASRLACSLCTTEPSLGSFGSAASMGCGVLRCCSAASSRGSCR